MTNPIANAIAPLKEDAIVGAEEYVRGQLERLKEELANHDWKLESFAPNPSASMSKRGYNQAKANQAEVLKLVNVVSRVKEGRDYIRTVEWSKEKEAMYVAEQVEEAGVKFDLYVNKLTDKVGKVTSATLTKGTNVWKHSELTVTREDGVVEVWRTQQVSKHSCLGKFHHQWPTRKVK